MNTEQNNPKINTENAKTNPTYLDDGSVIYRQKPASSSDIYLLYISAFALMLAILFIVKFFFPGTSTSILVIIFILLNILLEGLIMQKLRNYSFSALLLTDAYFYIISRPLVIFKKVKAIPWVEIKSFTMQDNGKIKLLLKNDNSVSVDLQRLEDFDSEKLLEELNTRI